MMPRYVLTGTELDAYLKKEDEGSPTIDLCEDCASLGDNLDGDEIRRISAQWGGPMPPATGVDLCEGGVPHPCYGDMNAYPIRNASITRCDRCEELLTDEDN
jgi:hypothetical protein